MIRERPKRRGWGRFDKVARNHRLAIALCAGLAFSVGAIFTAIRVPVPKVHDEFSYLLAADTFASGQVTNRTPLFWEHFETFHVIQQPSYTSKYQPGQGLVLAIGVVFGGHPIVGAWIASAIAAAAICWMLQGWVPSRWALVGGVLVALHGMIAVRWSLSYWGGSLPMAGGALMFGGLAHTMKKPRVLASTLMACGAVLLAATRPFEGILVGVSVTVALLVWMFSRKRPDWLTIASHVVIPASAVLWFGIAILGTYNCLVTGDPFRLPYQVHEQEYGYSPLFLWKSPKPMPEYQHDAMRDYYAGWAIEDYSTQQSLAGWWLAKSEGLHQVGRFFLGGVLWLPLLLMLRRLLAQRRLRFAWVVLGVFLIAELSVCWIYPHYFAPAVPLVFLLVVQGLRHLATLPRRGHAWARFAVPAILVMHILALPPLFAQYVAWEPEGWQFQRARIEAILKDLPGEHLVFVEYGPGHSGHEEWVYNKSNIAKSKIVWARTMGEELDSQLLRFYHDRQIWRVDADTEQPTLIAVENRAFDERYDAFDLDAYNDDSVERSRGQFSEP